MAFADRAAFASPYPEGIAAGHVDVLGDASGGSVSASFDANGGFLYRLELMNVTVPSASAVTANYVTAHRWITDRTGLGPAAFDLNWIFSQGVDASFSVFTPTQRDMATIRRVPIGRTDDILSQVILSLAVEQNVDGGAHDFDVILTYWPVESLYRPGFLSSFWEAPIVPTFL